MRVKDLLKMYRGMNRIGVQIYAIVTVFNEKHCVLVAEFKMDCTKIYSNRTENYLAEEILGFDISDNILHIYIRGYE